MNLNQSFISDFSCQQEHLVTSVIRCKFQKNLYEVRFFTIFFMILSGIKLFNFI